MARENKYPTSSAAEVGPKIIPIKADAQVALVGDWGTGAQPAIQILKHIAGCKPDVLIHLGDIYYSGTPAECASNFSFLIEQLVRRNNPSLLVYTLAGNHDMYCGGAGYYDLICRLNPHNFMQPASFV